MALLSEQDIAQGIQGLDWEYRNDAIHRRFSFPSFMSAIAFVNRVAEAAEQEDHHPDILVNYRAVTLTLTTHSEGGVTKKDLAMAHKLDPLGQDS